MVRLTSFALKWLLAAAIVVVVGHSLALGAGTYALDWFTVKGGGGTASGGSYQLNGTIGQFDAGGLTGGTYTLVGGFWDGGSAPPPTPSSFVYLPLIKR